MFVSARRHQLEIDRLSTELKSRDDRIAELERGVCEVERTRHALIEEVRYLIEGVGDHVRDTDSIRGEHLCAIGHVLPYLLSRRRTWDGPEFKEQTDETIGRAKELATEYDFALPAEPVLAVKAMLDLASFLLNPVRSGPLKGLQALYPLADRCT